MCQQYLRGRSYTHMARVARQLGWPQFVDLLELLIAYAAVQRYLRFAPGKGQDVENTLFRGLKHISQLF